MPEFGSLLQLNLNSHVAVGKLTCSNGHPCKAETKKLFSLHLLFPVYHSLPQVALSLRPSLIGNSNEGLSSQGPRNIILLAKCCPCKSHICFYICGTWEIWVSYYILKVPKVLHLQEGGSGCSGCQRNPNPKGLEGESSDRGWKAQETREKSNWTFKVFGVQFTKERGIHFGLNFSVVIIVIFPFSIILCCFIWTFESNLLCWPVLDSMTRYDFRWEMHWGVNIWRRVQCGLEFKLINDLLWPVTETLRGTSLTVYLSGPRRL